MHLGIEPTDERLIIGQLRGMCHSAFQINKARSVVLPAKSSPQMWSCCYVRLSLRIVVMKQPSLRQPWLLEQDGGPSKGSRRRSLTKLRGKSHSHWQGAFSSQFKEEPTVCMVAIEIILKNPFPFLLLSQFFGKLWLGESYLLWLSCVLWAME